MTQTSTKQIIFKPWQAALIVLLLIAVFGFLAAYLLKSETARPIVIEPQRLSSVQLSALQKVIEPMGGVRFFSADLLQIQQKISQLSWVESVSVRRDWNQGVVVAVTARKPVANFGSDRLLDANGVVYEPADSGQLMDSRLVNLHGRDGESGQIMQQLKQVNAWFAPLGIHVQDLILTPRQTWVIRFNNGMRIVVDYENTEQKLYNLAIQLKTALANDFAKIDSVDLRYKNGFAIAWRH
ncbi:cell division protein FtsQ/DivIB [Moraxella marmotae]|uniref:cell division protein FtsQ/DivIB n=1 Tax=Moraxella marmotae TaxID=3344520 RepID=UPI0035F49FE1